MMKTFQMLLLSIISTQLFGAGVGIECNSSGLFPRVASIREGSSAAVSGVPLDGAIMKIGGKDMFGKKGKDAQKLLEGEAGTQVVVIITGIYRTDTFKLIRGALPKPACRTPDDMFCPEFSALFLPLQENIEQLRGKPAGQDIWYAKKAITAGKSSYLKKNNSLLNQATVYNVVLETAPEGKEAMLDSAFIRFKPLVDMCIADWKLTIDKIPNYEVNFENHSWAKGNLIINLFYNREESKRSLELTIENVK
jgi:hypothetical protein